MLFLPALSAACGLEAQEEIFPGNKFRYTELRLEGTLPVSGYPTPLYLFRRAARTQDGYVFDRSYTSVADGETLKLPLAELKAYDYRFRWSPSPATRNGCRGPQRPGHSSSRGVAWGRPAAGMRLGGGCAGRLQRLYRLERRGYSPRRQNPPHADTRRRAGALRHLPHGKLALAARKHPIARCGVGDRPDRTDRNLL